MIAVPEAALPTWNTSLSSSTSAAPESSTTRYLLLSSSAPSTSLIATRGTAAPSLSLAKKSDALPMPSVPLAFFFFFLASTCVTDHS